MISKTFLTALFVLGLLTAAAAQTPCDNPYADSCRMPEIYCAKPMSECPWSLSGIDVVFMVRYFKGGPAPSYPYSRFDVNCNGRLNGMDVVYLVNFLKGQGPALKCCFYQCSYHPPAGSGCTWQLAWWKNHAGFGPQPDLVSPLLPLWLGLPDGARSIHVTSAQIVRDIMRSHDYGNPSDGISKLYAQLLAAKLNIADSADSRAIDAIIAASDNYLARSDWQDWGNLGDTERDVILQWVNLLADYNNGRIGPGRCEEEK